MAKKSAPKPPETCLEVPQLASLANTQVTPIYDTHTHLHSTFEAYRSHYPTGRFTSIKDFVHGFYGSRTSEDDATLPAVHVPVKSIIDVWCEAPVLTNEWRALADSALTPELRAEHWGDVDYHFVMGVHPHEAKHYTDEVEAEIKAAMQHPRNVGWGEMGLDYHYDNSPRDIQRDVFVRQLKCAVELEKPLTIHTREADEDTFAILTEHVPKDWKIHIHCFTDSVDFAQRLLNHFPNLYIGITGVTTYTTNLTTPEVIRILASNPPNPETPDRSPLRIVLETDAPYMVPSNLTNAQQKAYGLKSNARLPLCHTGMIPWTAEYVANIVNQGVAEQIIKAVEAAAASGSQTPASSSSGVEVPTPALANGGPRKIWTAAEVLQVARDNAKALYGV